MSGANSTNKTGMEDNMILQAKEYLVANNLGGYSSSTYVYGNTRKYHGILVAANSCLDRFNVVNRLQENLIIGDARFPLTPNIYENHLPASGDYTNLESFRLNDFPEWHYQYFELGVNIKKSLVQETGKNKTIVRYEINSKQPGKFSCLPLLTFRNIHEVRKFSIENIFKISEQQQDLLVELEFGKNLRISGNFPRVRKVNEIYYNIYYPVEAERGYEATEDLQAVCEFIDEFPAGFTVLELIFNFEDYNKDNTSLHKEKELYPLESYDYFAAYNKTRSLLLADLPNFKASSLSRLGSLLIKQADQFLVKSSENDSPRVIAGYHWFAEWGRDTFISFPGLFLNRKLFAEAKKLLLAWRKLVKNGLIPNTTNNSSYASLDAIFWYILSIWQYFIKSNDSKIFEEIEINQLLDEVWDSFYLGTNQVKIDNFGFLHDYNNTQALTWMDAKLNNQPVINRSGRAVEIQALWFTFLEIALKIKKIISNDSHSEIFKFTRDKLKIYFPQFFWLDKHQCLNDCLPDIQNPENKTDFGVRLTPNQIIAISLPFQVLSKIAARKVLKFCEKYLLTDSGLKTLVTTDQNYHGDYSGSQEKRDAAYHQGTIWPFLLGLYLKSYLQNYNYNAAAKAYVRGHLGRLLLQLDEQHLDYVPEIFAADNLRARGALSQCWSATCLLEVIYLLKSY